MNASLARLLRSPLVHFALAGALLFAAAAVLDVDRRDGAGGRPPAAVDAARADRESAGRDAASGEGCPNDADPAAICVEREALLAFIQSRTRTPRIEAVASAFDAATEAVRRDWIDRYVREEALVREARALGLDREDELVRRRLVQQMEFLAEGTDARVAAPTEAELEAAYRARADELRHPATFRFAHVFVAERAGGEGAGGGAEGGAAARAKALLGTLNAKPIAFEESYAYGDRFPYDRTYVDRTEDEIRSHFGDAFVETLAALEPELGRWSGPHRSEHGLHLVLLVDARPARAASLEEVREELREALQREARDRAVEQGVAAIVAKYRVALGGGVTARTEPHEPP